MSTLKIEWIDPRGTVWHLTEGTEGVLLDLDQQGLGWSEIEHSWMRGEMVHGASRVARGVHKLKVTVGWSPVNGYYSGDAMYRLIDEWWSKANSPFELGTLRVIRPDGVVRSRSLRLAASPDTSYRYDPGLGMEPQVELWALTGDGGWWDGPEQTHAFSAADLTGGDTTPFYGSGGAGWPLYISSGVSAGDAWIQNRGQGKAWLTWVLVGPLTNPRFGVAGPGVLTFSGVIPEGQIVEVVTDPERRRVVDEYAGESLYSAVSGVWAPAPVGDRVPLSISADAIGEGGSITAIVRERFATAF